MGINSFLYFRSFMCDMSELPDFSFPTTYYLI